MASRLRWLQFLSLLSAQHPGGVIDQLFTDWRKVKAQAQGRPTERSIAHGRGHNTGSFGRIAQMLADRLRHRR